MKIFLSYASEDRGIADKIFLSLVQRHEVFFDHTGLRGGDDFDSKIQAEIKKCELFIFLISPDSISRSSYALTELAFAREKWSHPEGHVLPVMIRETSYDAIPAYLSAVTVLEPQGNVVAEVRARVEGWEEKEGAGAGIGKFIAVGGAALLALAVLVFIIIKFSGGNGGNNNQLNANINQATPQNTTTPVKNTSPQNNQTNNSPVNNQPTPNRNFRIPIRNLKIRNANVVTNSK
jgi:hypothetical protein